MAWGKGLDWGSLTIHSLVLFLFFILSPWADDLTCGFFICEMGGRKTSLRFPGLL